MFRKALARPVLALQRSKGLQQTVLGNAKKINLVSSSEGINESASIVIDTRRLDNAYEHIARAIHYYHTKKRWDGAVMVNTEFTISQDSEVVSLASHPRQASRDLSDKLFQGATKHGANQRVFYYQTIESSESLPSTTIRLTFYGGTRVTTIFTRNVTDKVAEG